MKRLIVYLRKFITKYKHFVRKDKKTFCLNRRVFYLVKLRRDLLNGLTIKVIQTPSTDKNVLSQYNY